MRVQPRPLITLGIAVIYMAIVGITWAVVGLDYDAVGDSTSTVVKGIVIPVVLGAIFLAVATSYLGWWRPAIRETMRAPKWLWAVPVLMALPGLGAVLGGAPSSDRSLGYLVALAVGTLFVGFSEEMLCRGTGLVGLRGGFKEPLAWAPQLPALRSHPRPQLLLRAEPRLDHPADRHRLPGRLGPLHHPASGRHARRLHGPARMDRLHHVRLLERRSSTRGRPSPFSASRSTAPSCSPWSVCSSCSGAAPRPRPSRPEPTRRPDAAELIPRSVSRPRGRLRP